VGFVTFTVRRDDELYGISSPRSTLIRSILKKPKYIGLILNSNFLILPRRLASKAVAGFID